MGTILFFFWDGFSGEATIENTGRIQFTIPQHLLQFTVARSSTEFTIPQIHDETATQP